MKKVLKRIFMLAFVLVIGYQQFTYADVVSVEPIDILKLPAILGGFVCVVILVVSAISFLTLKFTTKKNVENFEDNKNKDLKMYKKMMYVCVIILSIVCAMYAWSEYKVPVLLIPIIVLVISIIFRLNKEKKISNIICGIAVVCICIVSVINFIQDKKRENEYIPDYVKNYSKYEGTGIRGRNIRSLIMQVQANSASSDIIEHNIKYILNNGEMETININQENTDISLLMSKIKKTNKYTVEISYEKKKKNKYYIYIVNIFITQEN